MIDSSFFGQLQKIKVSELAKACGFEKVGDKDFVISGAGTLKQAGETEVSFFGNKKYIDEFRNTKAGAVIIAKGSIGDLPEGVVGLVCDNVMIGCAKALDVLCQNDPYVVTSKRKVRIGFFRSCILRLFGGCRCNRGQVENRSSNIHETAKIGTGCNIARDVVIGENVEIGDNVIIGHGTVIEANCKIGSGCKIRNSVSISFSIIGQDVIINSGARIGESGFGIIPTGGKMVYVKQLGRVIIGDRVRIGSNTTIDRGSIEDTVIGNDTIIDNLVQIGHNVHIGERCIIVAQVGIAGSTVIGNDVVLAGQVGVAGHVKIGNGVVAAAKSGIASNISDRQIVGGIPAVDIGTWKRQAAFLKMSVTRKKDRSKK